MPIDLSISKLLKEDTRNASIPKEDVKSLNIHRDVSFKEKIVNMLKESA